MALSRTVFKLMMTVDTFFRKRVVSRSSLKLTRTQLISENVSSTISQI